MMKKSDMFDDDPNDPPPQNPSFFSNNYMPGLSPFRVNGSPISRNNNSSFYGSIPTNNWGYDGRFYPPMQGYPMPPIYPTMFSPFPPYMFPFPPMNSVYESAPTICNQQINKFNVVNCQIDQSPNNSRYESNNNFTSSAGNFGRESKPTDASSPVVASINREERRTAEIFIEESPPVPAAASSSSQPRIEKSPAIANKDSGSTTPGKSQRISYHREEEVSKKIAPPDSSIKSVQELPVSNTDVINYDHGDYGGDNDGPKLQRRNLNSSVKNTTLESSAKISRSNRHQQMDSLLSLVSCPRTLPPPSKRPSLSASDSKPASATPSAVVATTSTIPSSSPSVPAEPVKINMLSGNQVRSKRNSLSAPVRPAAAAASPSRNDKSISNEPGIPHLGTKRKASEISKAVTASSTNNKDADDGVDIDIGSESDNDSDSAEPSLPVSKKAGVAFKVNHSNAKVATKKAKSKKDSLGEKEKTRKGLQALYAIITTMYVKPRLFQANLPRKCRRPQR